jgi:hypothetical protein
LLEELGCVTPGKSISELKVLFLGRECYENLPEKDVMEIYELHQREIIQKAKKNFQVIALWASLHVSPSSSFRSFLINFVIEKYEKLFKSYTKNIFLDLQTYDSVSSIKP